MSDTEQQDDAQKTEDPTPKKLEEARKKGQVALSREVNTWLILLMSTIVVIVLGPSMAKSLLHHMGLYIENAHMLPGAPGGMKILLEDSFYDVLGIVAIPLLLLMAAAILGPFLQIGPLFAPEIIKPDVSKVSPLKGFERLFSMRSIMELVKGILKLTVIAVVGTILLEPYFKNIEHVVGLGILQLMDDTMALILRLMIGVLVVLFVVAVIDLVYQRFEYYKKMRMTKQELKDEYKQTEGDPHIRARLRQLRQERARARMMQAVPTADVIITNPTHYSIALKYDPEKMDAPKLVAKGINEVALRIRELAREHDITIVENPPLARVLFDAVDIDDYIPQEHYKAVAEVISYVFRLKGKLRPANTP